MNYGVGDTVVCVDAKSAVGLTPVKSLRLGATYTIAGFGGCGGVALVGINPDGFCSNCEGSDHTHYRAWRFIKLDGLKDEETERTEAPIRENA